MVGICPKLQCQWALIVGRQVFTHDCYNTVYFIVPLREICLGLNNCAINALTATMTTNNTSPGIPSQQQLHNKSHFTFIMPATQQLAKPSSFYQPPFLKMIFSQAEPPFTPCLPLNYLLNYWGWGGGGVL